MTTFRITFRREWHDEIERVTIPSPSLEAAWAFVKSTIEDHIYLISVYVLKGPNWDQII